MEIELGKRAISRAAMLATMLAPPLSQANAVTTLREDTHFRVDASGRSDYTKTIVERINDAEAVSNNRIIPVWFDITREKIDVRKACIESRNGRCWCVPKSRISLQPGTLHLDGAEYTYIRALGIPFEKLAVGDTLSIVIHSTMFGKPPVPNQILATSVAGSAQAPGSVSLSIDMPANMPMQAYVRGFSEERTQAAHGRRLYRWRWKGQPDPRMEAGAIDTALRNAQVSVSTLKDYASLAHFLDEAYVSQSIPDQQLSQFVERLLDGITEPRKRALTIYHWMQDNIRYEARYGVDGKIVPKHSAPAIYHTGSGDCKDHVVLLGALLRTAGIESLPALIDMRKEYFSLPETPLPYFNHVITYIPSLDLYLDSTFKDANGAYLPNLLQDKPVLLTRTGRIAHTPFYQSGPETRSMSLSLRADGSASFDYQEQTNGLRGALVSHRHAAYRALGPGALTASLLAAREWAGSGTEEFNVPSQTDDAYSYRLHGTIDRLTPPGEPMTLKNLSPLNSRMPKLYTELGIEPVRTQPFLCDPEELEETVEYILPHGLEPAALPHDADAQSGILRYAASYRRTGQRISVTRRFHRFKHGTRICTPADFEQMRPVFDVLREDQEQTISLRPTSKDATTSAVE